MKSGNLLIFLLLCLLVAGCGGGGSDSNAAQKTLASIAVTPATPVIAQGGTQQQFTATGTFSDNTTQDLTSIVTWTSSAPAIATISAAGLATSVATGTTTITATSGEISGSTTLTVTGGNTVAITVNGSLCSPMVNMRYLNKACVSVTVCSPGTSTCQTINDILLDTGSYGLRIFQQALTVPLTAVTNGSGSLAECVQFVDGSSLWGPVQTASVILGNEPAVQVPIQVINSAFGTLPPACQDAEPTPSAAGFTGILGVGLFDQDCGTSCANSASNGMYYACSGSTCSGTRAALASQVRNPVALLPQDNNGVIVQLPSIPPGGAASVNGSLILGIGTQSNNTLSGVTTFPANQFGEFLTTFDGVGYDSSFIDSGSNGIFFTPPASTILPTCASPNTDWFCPPSTTTFTATTTGASGTPSSTVEFQIGNFTALINTSNNVFNDIGGPLGPVPGNMFDWGLPFFFGRNVVVGIQGKASTLGTGPYWAY